MIPLIRVVGTSHIELLKQNYVAIRQAGKP